MPKVNISSVELWALKSIFVQAGWEVYGGQELVTIYDVVKDTQDKQTAMAAQITALAQQVGALDLSTLSGHVSDLQTAVSGLSAGQTLEESDLATISGKADAAKAELDAINAQLNPTPTPTP